MPNTAPLPGSTIERLFDAIDMPIGCWDAQHRLCPCNATYLRWAGQTHAQLLGRTLAELYGDDAWAAARDAFGEALAGREASYERLLTHRDGAPRWTRVKVFPEIRPDGSVASVYTIAVDIHDDVTQREVLQAAQRRLDRFTDNIPYPLTYVDRDFTIRFVNKAYCAATGMAAEALVGRHIGEVRGSRRWEEHRPYFERALAGESVQYTRLAELGTSGQRWLRTSYEPDRGADGEVLGLYTVSIDVHEMTLVQERLRRRVERDALTQVLSRRALIERIDAALPGASEAPLALFFVDLDGFKEVNDTLGHREGDRLLAAVAAALQGALRAEDCVGRFGGDEFIVLARVHDRAGAHALAVHLLQAVQTVQRWHCRLAGGQREHRLRAGAGRRGSDPAADPARRRGDVPGQAPGRNRAAHCNDEPR